MAPDIPPSFPLPAVHVSLSPYIHTPTETLQTRQILTTHLNNLAHQPRISTSLGSSDEFTRFLDLELSRTPSIWRDYLLALRENAAARAEYTSVLNSIPNDPDSESEDEGTPPPLHEHDWKRIYLEVLRLRRQHSRLTVLREGVGALSSVPTTRPPGGLAGAYTPKPPSAPPALNPASTPQSNELQTSLTTQITSIVLALEKQIIATESRLHAAQSRARHSPPTPGPPTRQALEATHSALTGWVESALSAPSQATPTLRPTPTTPQQTTTTSPEEISARVAHTYNAYLSSRHTLLTHLTAPPITTDVPPLPEDPPAEPTNRLLPIPAPRSPEVLHILGAVEHLLPLSHAQKAALTAQNTFAAQLRRQRDALTEVFEGGDPVEEARKVVGRANARFGKAVAKAENNIESARGSLGRATGVVEEVSVLVGKEVKGSKRGIPVRGQKAAEVEKKGVWKGLDGGVGVIGDGI